MKKPVLTCLTTLGLALGAYAQGSLVLNNAIANNGVADLTAGNYYSGTYGLALYELYGTTVPAGINPPAQPSITAYNAMLADGFTALTGGEFDNQTMTEGTIALGTQTFANLPVGNVVLGLVVWNNSQTLGQLLTAPGPGPLLLGVLAIPQTTVNLSSQPPGVPLDLHAGWNSVGQDLIMTFPIPEPGLFALAGLGLAAVLIFRRRK